MISSFFGKSKPINIVLVLILIAVVFLGANFKALLSQIDFYTILRMVGFMFLTVFMVFVVDFIIGKNDLTQKNSFTILVFGLFIAILPVCTTHINVIMANVFILFALRRLMSLKSNISVKKKLFDASFWIALASLCYFWAIIFFVLVIVALAYYWQNDIKNVIVVFIGFCVVVLLFVSYNIVVYNNYIPEAYIIRPPSFDFSALNSIEIVIGASVLLALFAWTVFFYLKTIQEKSRTKKVSRILILVAAITALFLVVITPDKSGSELLFLFFPLAVITTNYLEKMQDHWFKEALLILLTSTPIALLMLQFLSKS